METTDSGSTTGLAELEEGRRLEREGNERGAEDVFRRGDEAGNASCAWRLGVVLVMRGEVDEAEAAFRRSDERGDADGSYNLGLLRERERGDLEGAVGAWQRADSRGDAYNLGCFYVDGGRLDEAEQAWSRAADRGDGMAAANLGLLLKQNGDDSGSLAMRRTALGSSSSTEATSGRPPPPLSGRLTGAIRGRRRSWPGCARSSPTSDQGEKKISAPLSGLMPPPSSLKPVHLCGTVPLQYTL
jgi:TPR repeat protein